MLHYVMLSNQSNPWSVWFISSKWKRFRVVECHGYTVSEKQVPPWWHQKANAWGNGNAKVHSGDTHYSPNESKWYLIKKHKFQRWAVGKRPEWHPEKCLWRHFKFNWYLAKIKGEDTRLLHCLLPCYLNNSWNTMPCRLFKVLSALNDCLCRCRIWLQYRRLCYS